MFKHRDICYTEKTMKKRPQIKGRGADIYTSPEGQEPAAHADEPSRAPRPAAAAPRRMVTTYLPEPLVERLQEEWLKRVKTDKKAQKAHIITEALERYFKDLDSRTSEHSDVKTSTHSDAPPQES
jgi:hypothetical protein